MTLRRALLSLFLLASGALPAAAELSPKAWQPKSGDVISFNVLREGKPFGSHAVKFTTDANGALVATTSVSLKAGLGPVTVFRYKLDATETALNVSGTDFKGVAPAGIVPASHWNYAQTLTGKLLSTEDGEILNVKVVNKGREAIKVGKKTIEANRYLMDSALDVDLWYDDDGRWVKLAFEARGQQIEYVLASLY
jgi:hypothetical protein